MAEAARKPQMELVASEPKPTDSMLALIERVVVRPDIDVSKLQQLLELRERFEATEARKAYTAAMKRFKDTPPAITKNKRVQFGTTNYNHATLDHICDAVTKGLSAVGITHAWKVAQADGVITVNCVLTHELGHSEGTQLMGLPDNSGSKNAIQAIGSTVTYLQRYTLLAACGLAASNDDDGQGGPSSKMDQAELAKATKEITEAKTLESLKFLWNAAYAKAQEAHDSKAMLSIIEAKDRRKQELVKEV